VELSILSSVDLFAMARYSLGLITIVKDAHPDEKFNTRGITLATGLKFFYLKLFL
jgi:hypothetical protein